MTLPLDEGLDSPFAEQILKEMDVSGSIGLKNAPDDLLREAKERTRGYPRALEALYGILAADRNTTLEEVLADAERLLPENVVEVLVGEAFNRLDTAAQMVMQSLAVYGRPVTPTAVDYMLSPYLPGVNAAPILSRLVNMQFVRKEGGKYYLHPVDRAYALARIPKGDSADGKEESGKEAQFVRIALSRRGADYFEQARLPKEQWKTLDDLAPQLAEIELRIASEDFDEAAWVLADIDFNYLLLWGHYRLSINLHERLQGKVMDSFLKQTSVGNMGSAYSGIGQIQKAIGCYDHALTLAREAKNRGDESAWLGNLGNCYARLGQIEKAFDYYEQALKIDREIKNRKEESIRLGNMGVCYSILGHIEKSIEYLEQSLIIKREIVDRQGEAIFLNIMGGCYSDLGQIEKAIIFHNQSIQIADEISYVQIQNVARFSLVRAFLFLHDFTQARTTAENARKYDYTKDNYSISAFLGIITLRQNDIQYARQSFQDAVSQADQILNQTPQYFDALYAKALALAGLAVCEHPQNKSQEYVESAKAAFRQAREICSAKGVVSRTLKLFDALAMADEKGILGGVREAAGGEDGHVKSEN
jgi:tetratricopeptide (TPR) repeat protein